MAKEAVQHSAEAKKHYPRSVATPGVADASTQTSHVPKTNVTCTRVQVTATTKSTSTQTKNQQGVLFPGSSLDQATIPFKPFLAVVS